MCNSYSVFSCKFSVVVMGNYNHFMALWTLSGTTRVRRYQNKHSPTHTYRGHQSSLICFLHLIRSMASLFNLCAWQSFSAISLQVFFGLLHGLAPSTSYCIYFFSNHCLLFVAHGQTHTHTTVLRLCGICPGKPGWAGTRRTFTHYSHRSHQSSLSAFSI